MLNLFNVMRFGLFITALLVANLSFGQSAYKLDFSIHGLRDTTVYLAYYYGESTFVRDTAQTNAGSSPLTVRPACGRVSIFSC